MAQINDAFDNKVNDPDYARKLFLIENCIYGVDIQAIAVQISKLRFFISLVVEQKVDKEKDNFGIRPLPNLETKFVAANTLIGIDKPARQAANPKLKELESELKAVRHRLFSAKTPRTKRKLREEDKSIRENIGELLVDDGWGAKTAEQLASWNPYNQNASSEFFDSEWMFGVQEGFDVVIGNPPYKIVGADQPKEQSIYKSNYEMASYKINTYILFLEKGLSLLGENKATISYIIPKSLVFNTYLKDTRNILLSRYSISKIVEINERVFDNVEVGDNIIFFARTSDNPLSNELTYLIVKNIYPFSKIDSYCSKQKNLVEQHDSNFYSKEIISDVSVVLLKDISKISNGLNPGNVRHILLSEYKMSEMYQRMLLGRDIQRYDVKWSGTWVNYDVNLKKTLSSSDIKSKKGMTAQKKVDFSLRKEFIFKPNKIIVRKTSDHIIAAYDSEELYYDSLSYGIHLKETTKISIYYILALLNSKYINYIHESISLNKGKTFAKVLLKNLAQLPIISIDFLDDFETNIHNNIVCLVHVIMGSNEALKQLIFEKVLDGLVFQLYFPNHMQEKQIDIAQLVNNDLSEVLQNKDFKELSDQEKEDIINQLHSKWTHPDNEVRNRIKLFAVRSPDILKPILESQP